MTAGISLHKPKFGLVLLLLLGAILALVVMGSPSPAMGDDASGHIDESESNDVFGDADPIEFGDLYSGSIDFGFSIPSFDDDGNIDFKTSSLFDIDWLSFSALAGTRFVARTVYIDDLADTILALYDTDGTTPLLTNDDCDLMVIDETGTEVEEFPLGDLESCLRFTTTATGTYYLLVVGFGEFGAYDLELIFESFVPVADDQSVFTNEDTNVDITLTGSDLDSGPLPLAFSVVLGSGPTNGILIGDAPDLTYSPNAGFIGTDSFTFEVTDGKDTSAPATVSITVDLAPENIPPAGDDQRVSTAQDMDVGITLTGSDSDSGPSSLAFSVVLEPTNGTLTGTPPNMNYSPNTGYSGPDSFTFEVFDGEDTSPTATVSITVNEVLETSPRDLKEDAATTLGLLSGDNDGSKSQKELDKAIKHIEKSLKLDRWDGDDRLVAKKGKKVFDEERKAVKTLNKIIKDKGKASDPAIADAVSDVIDALVEADRILAQTAIDFVGVAGDPAGNKVAKEIAKADKEMDKALEEIKKGKRDKAINKYKKAWEHAQKAIKHASK